MAKDSHNSSKPPSSDPPFKKPPPKSLRTNRGQQPGGQKQHPGAKLEIAHADETGVRIGGKRHWLPVLSATCLTPKPCRRGV